MGQDGLLSRGPFPRSGVSFLGCVVLGLCRFGVRRFEVSFGGMDENEGILGGSGQETYAHSGQLAAAIKTYEKIVKLTTEFVANREKQAGAKD